MADNNSQHQRSQPHRQPTQAATLRYESALLQSLLGSLPDLVFYKDTTGVYLGCNDAFAAFAGREKSAIVGKTDFDLFPHEVAAFFREQDEKMMAQGEARRNEEWVAYPDGRRALLDTLKSPFYDDDNVLVGLVGISRDITPIHDSQSELQQNQERLAEANRVSKIYPWEFDLATQMFTFVPEYFEFLGTSVAENGGLLISAQDYATQFVPPEEAAIVAEEVGKAVATNDPNYNRNIESLNVTADGRIIPIRVRFRIQKDEHGNTVKILGANQDVSEQKAAELQLQENQERLAEALADSKLYPWEFDMATQMFTFTPEYLELLGTSVAENGGLRMSAEDYATKFVPPEERASIGQGIEAALATDDPNDRQTIESKVLTKDGRIIPIIVRVKVQKDEHGATIKMRGANQDVSEREAFTNALQKRAEELQTVAEVATNTASALDEGALLQNVVDLTKERFSLYHAHIYLLDEGSERLVLTAGAGDVGRQMVADGRSIPLDREQSLVARAARTSAGVIVNDVQADPGFLPHPLLPDTRAEMAVPMIVSNQVIGVLDVQADLVNRFTDQDVQIQTTLAAQTAVALQNVRLFTQSDDRAKELAFVNRVVTEINTLDINKGLQFLAEELGGILQIPSAVIGLIDDTETMLELVAAHHPAEIPSPVGAVFPVAGDPIMSRAIQTRQTVVVEDVPNSDLPPQIKDSILKTGTHAMYVIPMIVGRNLIGTVSVNVVEGGSLLTAAQIELAETTVYQAATAVQNARLFEQVQTALRNIEQSEGQLSEALRIAKLGYWEFDVEKDLFTFNDQFYALFHTTAEQHGGYQLSSAYYAEHFVHPDDMPLVGSEIGRALSATDQHYTRQLEHRVLYADGGIGYISVNVNVERDEAGNILRFYGANQDITERRQAEESLRRSEADLSEALRIAKLGYWEFDVEKDLFTFNDQFYALFHTTAEQHGGYQLSSAYYAEHFVHPDDMPLVGSEIGRALSATDQHYTRQLEHRILYADGSIGYISVNVNVERDEAGNILRFYGANQDISERQAFTDALQKRAEELQTVAEVATNAAAALDEDTLLQNVVDLTKDRFGLYHVHIYLLDDAGANLVLAAGAGDVGQKMVADRRSIPLDREQSLVARAARTGAGVIVNDVQADPGFLPNTLLPDTRAEMAVPMIVSNQVLGVLDVQADLVDRFTDQDVQIQTTLAAQTAVALQNVRLLDEAQTAIAELDVLTRRLTRESWQGYLQSLEKERFGFAYDYGQLLSLDAPETSALESENGAPLAHTITVRGEQVGHMVVLDEFLEDAEEDAFSPEEAAEIVAAVAAQLSTQLESLRLTEQTQQALSETAALYEAGAQLNAAHTYDDVLEVLRIHTEVGQQAQQIGLDYFDRPLVGAQLPDYFDVLAYYTTRSQPIAQSRFQMSDFPELTHILRPDQPTLIEDVRTTPLFQDNTRATFLKGFGSQSTLFIPLTVGGQWLGFINILYTEPSTFTPAQLQQAMALAAQAAVTIQTIRLFEETNQLYEREQTRAQREQMLREISARIRNATGVDSVMQTAVHEIGRALGRRAFVHLQPSEQKHPEKPAGVPVKDA